MELFLEFPPTPENGPIHAGLAVNAAWEVSRVDLDYSVASLQDVDAILERFHQDGVNQEAIGSILFAFGCYVGEVFVRHAHGQWVDVDASAMKGAASFMVLELPGGKYCNPIGKVFKRVENGDEDSVAYFFAVFGRPTARPWWKFW
jgi:hypothetical protein